MGHFALAVYPYFIGVQAASGAFYATTQLDNIADLLSANHISSAAACTFSSGRVVPVAPENRPASNSALVCISLLIIPCAGISIGDANKGAYGSGPVFVGYGDNSGGVKGN
jgi:hypothetical protein